MGRSRRSGSDSDPERKIIEEAIRDVRDCGLDLPRSPEAVLRGVWASLEEYRRTGQPPSAGFLGRKAREADREMHPRSPAQQAHSTANLPKMQAALKAQGYKRTPKRDRSNLQNLARGRAVRQKQCEERRARLAQALKQALPPLSQRQAEAHAQATETTGQAIRRKVDSMRRAAAGKGRQVMVLLQAAAGRAVGATLPQLLALANALIAVVADRRAAERWEKLQGRIGRLLAGKHEEQTTRLECSSEKRRPAKEKRSDPARDAGGAGSAPAADASAGGQNPHTSAQPARPPHLPPRFEDFQDLLDRAFSAPMVVPTQGPMRQVLDLLGPALWKALTVSRELADLQERAVEQELRIMAKTRPKNVQERAKRHARIERLLDTSGLLEAPKTLACNCRRWLAEIMRQLFGPDPRIEQFAAAND